MVERLASECQKFSYQLWCDWFCAPLGCRSLLTEFWISHNGNWSIYYWIGISLGEERCGACCSTLLQMLPLNEEQFFVGFFFFSYWFLSQKKMLSKLFFKKLFELQYFVWLFCSNSRLFRLLFWHISLQKKRLSSSNFRTLIVSLVEKKNPAIHRYKLF